MSEPPLINTERLVLRMANLQDVQEVVRYYAENQAHLTPWYPAWPQGYFTVEYWENLIAHNLTEFQEGKALRLYVFFKDEPDRVIATINFSNIIRGIFHSCNLGYSVAERIQGHGYMFEGVQAAINYVFDDLNIHRVMANYIPHNQRSGKLLQKLGFVVEGYARDYLLINGTWQDHILTSLINPDWKPS